MIEDLCRWCGRDDCDAVGMNGAYHKLCDLHACRVVDMPPMIHSTREKWRIAYEWVRTFDGSMVPDSWDCTWDVLRDLRVEYPRNAWSIFGMFLYARELRRAQDRLKKKWDRACRLARVGF
jgi:hypothetical protein